MKNKKIFKILTVLIVSMIFISACGAENADSESKNNSDEKIKITATLFPQYDFAKMIAKDKAEVEMILPAGTESHNYEPSPAEIISIGESDLFIYTGKYMETWAETIIESIPGDINVLDISSGILDEKECLEHDNHHDHGHEHNVDPHIWTNPVFAMKMSENIYNELCKIDPENAEYYKENYDNVALKLKALDESFRNVINDSSNKLLVFGGRFAFIYFVEEYGLSYVSAYDSCSSEAEPSAERISEIIKIVKEKDISVIYYEELSTGKVADIICEETGAEKILLHSCHNISADDFNSGITYFELMEQNLENLKKGLN